MSLAMIRFALMSSVLCICQVALAQDELHFWSPAGDHGIDGCFFTKMPTEEGHKRIGWIVLGVSVDPQKLELMGSVRLRQDGISPGRHVLEIGVGPQALVTVTLDVKDTGTATGHLPGEKMEEFLYSFVRQNTLWMRIDATTRWTVEQTSLKVVGKENEVSSCLAILKRELAEERALRAAGGMSDRF